MRLELPAHGDEPIRCDPGGCCIWIARSPVAAARRRLYGAGRGALAEDMQLESTCGVRRCVNLDHLRIVARAARSPQDARFCVRGHLLGGANVVRHRDGRIAYCRICRNDRRRERYRTDPEFATREMARQRRRRRQAKKTAS